MLDFSNFDCDRCGACCHLLIETTYCDVLREPKLLQYRPSRPSLAELRSGRKTITLYDRETWACPFLKHEQAEPQISECLIYPTRPTCCVSVEAGDAKCQQARRMKGFPMLCDRNGIKPSRKMMLESCDEYDMDFEQISD